MLRKRSLVILSLVICAAISFSSATTEAGTIIRLSMGGDSSPDIEFAGGVLSTVNDGNAGTTGEQNTTVDYGDILGSQSDISTPPASVTLNGLTATGPAFVFNGTLALQNFTGGNISLYDASNNLLLSGNLTSGALTGPLGPPATGGLFTTSFSAVTGGSLLSLGLIDPASLTLAMSVTNINGGAGLSVAVPAPGPPFPPIHQTVLNPFTSDVTLALDAELIPEPVGAMLALIGAALLGFGARARRPAIR